MILFSLFFIFFFKQKTAYEMRISDWSSDVCSSDLPMSTDRSEFSTVLSQNIHDPSKGSGDRRQNRLCADQARRTEDRESYRSECSEIGRASCRERVCQYV